MPALLIVLEDDILFHHRAPPDSTVVPLTLDFSLGGPPLGMYCSVTCFLVSHDNHFPCAWKIKLTRNSNSPTCLYRNCVRFSVPGFPGSVTLIDAFSHFSSSQNCSYVGQQISYLCLSSDLCWSEEG